jgi:hypothetical protein
MWEAGAVFFTSCTIVTLVAIGLIRSIIHRRRERRDGIGGTQDVAMIGVGIAALFALASVVCLVMVASVHPSAVAAPPSTQPLSTTQPSLRPADHLDVLEAVARYQLSDHVSADEPCFLSLDAKADPPPSLLARLSNVLPASMGAIDENRDAFRHKQDGRRGTLLIIGSVAWLGDDVAEVKAGWYYGPVGGGSETFRVERRNGKWSVAERKIDAIS